MIGSAQLQIISQQNQEGMISYIIHPDYWNKGFATETAQAVLSIGFHKFGLHRISATCAPSNLASAAVLNKIGMSKEGHLREHIQMESGWRDSFLYSILENEHAQK
ncbi:GNAT family N-acetyltransferase [Terribacillus sp. DMT04]|uniref:GNAT family N-acetyltransferase n=1 Tax=Terribacillus sp. DMT04 TaxID=2850441 RepID=UPI00211295B8|nr:GNAT family protein [Terribacillus sp. DMT04]